MRVGILARHNRTQINPSGMVQLGQRNRAIATEPLLEVHLSLPPLAVEHSKPGSVAIFPFYHHMLPEETFEDKAEPQGRCPAALVASVTFPFHATVVEVIKTMAQQEITSFRVCVRALGRRRVPNVPQLGHTVLRANAHDRDAAQAKVCLRAPHGEGDHIRPRLPLGQEVTHSVSVDEGAVRHVAPEGACGVVGMRDGKEFAGVTLNVQGLERNELSSVDTRLGHWPRGRGFGIR